MIVLNENEWAEEMIKQCTLGKKPYETLCRVAKYYTDKGFKKSDVRKLMDAFLIRCDPSASIPKWADTLDRVVSRAGKYNAICIDKIVITKPEMKRIAALEGVQTKRLAFTLLCLAKYYDIVNPSGDHWVNSSDSEVMKMANVSTSVKRQSAMYHELNKLGMVGFSKKVDNTNVRVQFIEDGETAYEVTDMRNLGYQYFAASGADGYIVCQNCGITTKKDKANTGRKQKYCKECAAAIKLRQSVESAMLGRMRKRKDLL